MTWTCPTLRSSTTSVHRCHHTGGSDPPRHPRWWARAACSPGWRGTVARCGVHHTRADAQLTRADVQVGDEAGLLLLQTLTRVVPAWRRDRVDAGSATYSSGREPQRMLWASGRAITLAMTSESLASLNECSKLAVEVILRRAVVAKAIDLEMRVVQVVTQTAGTAQGIQAGAPVEAAIYE